MLLPWRMASTELLFASGMAATDAILKTLQPGDEVIATNDLYGGTYRLFTKVYAKYGIEFRFVDLQDTDHLKKIITHKTKMIWIETPTNPMLNIIDIKSVCDIVKDSDVMVCVDNTFATPYLQLPFGSRG